MGPMEAAAWVAVILFFGFASFCSSAMIFAPFISEIYIFLTRRGPNQTVVAVANSKYQTPNPK
jgi:hypothetical protein